MIIIVYFIKKLVLLKFSIMPVYYLYFLTFPILIDPKGNIIYKIEIIRSQPFLSPELPMQRISVTFHVTLIGVI